LFITDYYNCILQASGSAAGSACFPVLGTDVQACNQQKHKDMVSMGIKYNRSANKRNITGEEERMIQMQRKRVRKIPYILKYNPHPNLIRTQFLAIS
jgi:hypothetical protein